MPDSPTRKRAQLAALAHPPQLSWHRRAGGHDCCEQDPCETTEQSCIWSTASIGSIRPLKPRSEVSPRTCITLSHQQAVPSEDRSPRPSSQELCSLFLDFGLDRSKLGIINGGLELIFLRGEAGHIGDSPRLSQLANRGQSALGRSSDC